MSGLDEILNIIDAQQKENEEKITNATLKKTESIRKEAEAKAAKAYDEYIARAKARCEQDYENARASTDSEMKRRILACKVELIDEAIDKALARLRALPDKDYFDMLKRLLSTRLRAKSGVIYLSAKDLGRIPASFEADVKALAEKIGGNVSISGTPAEISDGFILEYGLISENCSFSAVMEAEKEGVRDTAARYLFG